MKRIRAWLLNLWRHIARKPPVLPANFRACDGWPPIRGVWPDPPEPPKEKP